MSFLAFFKLFKMFSICHIWLKKFYAMATQSSLHHLCIKQLGSNIFDIIKNV